MNQQCKVCGEPAAGFHFGAFTCEGCKSFFGRSYNNLNSITECKNNGECIINKKNRTACKSCRLRKCLLVGMSKSGSRYGRRSNWFKIHCLLQEQQQAAVAQMKEKNSSANPLENPIPLLSPISFPHPNLGPFLRTNNPSSPSVSSPDSDSSEPGPYSPRMNGTNNFVNKDFYLPVPFQSMFMQPPTMTSPFLLPPSLLPFPVPPAKRCDFSQRLPSPNHVQNLHKNSSTPDLAEEDRIRAGTPPSRRSPTNNNEYSSKYVNNKLNVSDDFKNKYNNNNNNNNNFGIYNKNIEGKSDRVTVRSTRFYLDAILGLKDVSENDLESQNKKIPERNELEGEEEQEVEEKEEEEEREVDEEEGKDRFGKYSHRRLDTGRERTKEINVEEDGREKEEEQDNPIDLSVKGTTIRTDSKLLKNSCRGSVETGDIVREQDEEEDDVEVDDEDEREIRPKIYNNNNEELKPIPLDLSV